MEGSSTNTQPAIDRDRPFEFDTSGYERLLRRLIDDGYGFVGFEDADDGVVLQHDVDLSLDRALTMARLETTLRVDGTYFVPLDAPVHDVSAERFARTVRTLSRLGHDVGLQFDPHVHWSERPDREELQERVDEELIVLERLLEEGVGAVSFRDPPEWARDAELSGVVNASRRPDGSPDSLRIVDRERRAGDLLPPELPPSFRLVVHPGLWYPVERSESDVLDARRGDAHRQVDSYFEAFDVP